MISTLNPSRKKTVSRRASRRSRKGAIIVLTSLLMIAFMMLLAFAVDIGYVGQVNTELDRAVDSAALAGAGALIEGTGSAEAEALDFFLRNRVASQVIPDGSGRASQVAAWDASNPDAFDVQFGQWNMGNRTFSVSQDLPSAIRVSARYDNAPLFFARALGYTGFSVEAEAVARYQPRDIELVLDFSASMNDDSELKRIYQYGENVRPGIEANLLQIYQELGSPVYGNMVFTPQYISSTNTTTIKNTLGLNNVSYPYPSGSWNDYISYVKSSSRTPSKVGYRKKYGYLTFVNYLLEKRPKNSQTPALADVSAQPVTAVKDSVSIFMQYIMEVDTDDRVGLAIYNSPSQTSLLEQTLTRNFQSIIENIVSARQAGHYDYYTNIGAGMGSAIDDLDQNARPGAMKMIVLMTDGIANRPSGTSTARQYALDQAQVAADKRYPIVTISLGNGADTGLMQQVADITGGVHFNIPGGGTVTDYQDGLMDVFRQIADDRPLLLVK